MVPPGLLPQGRYRLTEPIATGGMGEVWRGSDLVLDRQVAIKLLHPERARDEECRARFRAEARHAGSLSHPNIAQVYDYVDAHPPCLVMELVDGPSLSALLAEGAVDPVLTVRVIAQTAEGLQTAHTAGLVHRDIKPGNLLLSRGGSVKITDFGIAYAVGSEPVTRTGMIMGTPAYLAPERAAGASATPAADLYALGVVGYQCLSGRLPFDGQPLAVAIAHLEQRLPPLPSSVPPGVAALVAALTAKDPRARPASAADVAAWADQLWAVLSGMPAVRTPPTAPAFVAPSAQAPSPGVPLRKGWRRDRAGRRRVRRALPGPSARPAAVLAGLAAVSLGGWALATMPGTSAAHPSATPPATSGTPSPSAAQPSPDGTPSPAVGAPVRHRVR
jgi:serine/threonine-protein kinase